MLRLYTLDLAEGLFKESEENRQECKRNNKKDSQLYSMK